MPKSQLLGLRGEWGLERRIGISSRVVASPSNCPMISYQKSHSSTTLCSICFRGIVAGSQLFWFFRSTRTLVSCGKMMNYTNIYIYIRNNNNNNKHLMDWRLWWFVFLSGNGIHPTRILAWQPTRTSSICTKPVICSHGAAGFSCLKQIWASKFKNIFLIFL